MDPLLFLTGITLSRRPETSDPSASPSLLTTITTTPPSLPPYPPLPLLLSLLYYQYLSPPTVISFLSLPIMSSQRYERVRQSKSKSNTSAALLRNPEGMTTMLTTLQVSNNEADTPISATPSSPPPSFRSVASSPTSRHFPHDSDERVDQNLADTFDADGSDSDEENDGDDRQRLMRGTPASSSTDQIVTPTTTGSPSPPTIERRATYLPVFAPQPAGQTGRVFGGGSGSDGVFSNLSAKPEAGEKMEEHPPVSYTITD